MKRILLAGILCLLLALAGCGSMIDREYLSVTPHTEQYTADESGDALTAENYLSLRNAILTFVQNGTERGVIRMYDYSGDVEEDLAAATYEVSKNDPLGAYAVDYMTHDCTQIVSYYEAHINITFRRTVEQIEDVQKLSSTMALTDLLYPALERYDSSLTVRVPYYTDVDIPAMVRAYYKQHPQTYMQLPEIAVGVYPEEGYVRIIELLFTYDQTSQSLLEKQDAVATSVRAAKEYVRYRETQTEKLQLLFTYLLERFAYDDAPTTTPVYSFLCEGIVGNEGAARSLQILCEAMDVECVTVEGFRGGEPYFWNIVSVDGVYCHVDLLRAVQSRAEQLPFFKDEAMTDYSWDAGLYPVCT